MKKYFLLIILFAFETFAQNKALYDVQNQFQANSPFKLSKIESTSDQISNSMLNATLLPGAYYTIGTVQGISNKKLDDNCALTFGHPYAKTSYPVFSLDGTWHKPEDYFSSMELTLSKSGDTLQVAAVRTGIISFTFTVSFGQNGIETILSQKIKNLDSSPHEIKTGIVFDPGLGKWGDGYLTSPSLFQGNSTIFQSGDIPNNFTIWEKESGAKGIGINLGFETEKPSNVIAANWNDLYNNKAPLSFIDPKTIYDLCMQFFWDGKVLQTNEEYESSLVVSLLQPDFSSQLFLRWDLQSFLSLQDNLLYPSKLSTYIEINKNASDLVNNVVVKLELPDLLSSSYSEYPVSLSSTSTFCKVSLTPHLKYEDVTEEIVARIFSNGSQVDEIHRNIFFPASPVSDTGLAVTIDSVSFSNLPKVELTFEAKKISNDYKITNLTKDNVFLYEDGNRIENYNMQKDTTGGINTADIVFVLDVTGSMSDEIDGVKNHIIEFADSLSYRGVDYRLGLVTFLDAIENIYPFTENVQTFHDWVASQHAHGGGDEPENSLQGLLEATKFSFRSQTNRIVIWITDATYHENDGITNLKKSDVINALLTAGVTVHAIGPEYNKSSYYDPIIIPTGGNFYDIFGNFRDILLDISRFKSSGKYLLSYQSNAAGKPENIKLQIRYAGLGGEANVVTSQLKQNETGKLLSFYPNPFNPEINFRVNSGDFVDGNLTIYNILGQVVKVLPLNGGSRNIVWNSENENGQKVSAGLYLVRLMLTDSNNYKRFETAKILYLK